MQILKITAVFGLLAAFAAAMLLVPAAQNEYMGIAKVLFEGTSYAKAFLFPVWIAGLLILWLIAEHGRNLGVNFRGSLYALIGVLAACWLLQFGMHAALLLGNGMRIDATASALVERNGVVEWEATQLSHIHASKAALCPILGNANLDVDTGCAMAAVVPWGIAAVVLVLAVVLLLLLVNEFLVSESAVEKILLAVGGFAALVSVFDGGPFSIVGKTAFGIMAAFVMFRKCRPTAGWQFFFAPWVALAAFLYASSFVLGSYTFFFGDYEVYAIGLFAGIGAIAKSGKWAAIVWSWVCIALAIAILAKASLFSYSVIPAGTETGLMVYGLPAGADAGAISAALSEFGTVSETESYGYIGFAKLVPSAETTTAELEAALRSRFKPRSYLYVLTATDISRATMRSTADLSGITAVKSSYFQFSEGLASGRQQILAEGLFPHPYMNLAALSWLHYTKGVETPVVFSEAR